MRTYSPATMMSSAMAALLLLAAVPAAHADSEEALKLYKSSCMVCHASGMANAPRLGDKARWAPLIAQGEDALMEVVINGKGAMPPRGAAPKATDEQLRSVVRYMVEKGS
ncbi:c-type cytochrome [Alcaligenes faecalis]|jgi:cytochrome c5|uniref:Cytochrome c5 family protein n=1 Tax=Alcaligenes faecalis TaxID=511 RepID=A0A2U2BIH1_ALCFA|nr:c-type cytochrome [Alcaligenes faecalis]MDK7584357.1 c-type cytochrome [Alcaligenes phenolicus]MBQ0217761.1 cytochrome c5 family protein [Alcaligenes faecalis]MBW4787435.1 c-type cytochrome [Alcaligenes faecalis subsp. faecalis]MBY6309641.1 cytochrome c5 family protein [Alcaligenes faecalis]MBY6318438.1 cytochrome c5 family protein [Alcaligenes faecalis]